MPGVSFRDDVEEARRTSIRNPQAPSVSSVSSSPHLKPSTHPESPAMTKASVTKKLWYTLGLALLLGAGGTALGVWNLVDDDSETVSVAQTGDASQDLSSNDVNQDDDETVYDISLTIDAIRQRGTLRCGLPFANTPGFAAPDQNQVTISSNYVGMDVDFCRALAAAVLGDASAVEFVETTRTDRWLLLHNNMVDVVMRSTHTAEDDVNEPTTGVGYTFSTPYYYDALMVGGKPPYNACANAREASSNVCSELRVCVQGGTPYEKVIAELFPEHHAVVPDQSSLYQSFIANACNVIAAEGYNLAPSTLVRYGYTGDYEVGEGTTDTTLLFNATVPPSLLAKVPLSMVTRQDDPIWSDVVEWTLQAIMEAEERGITKATASTFGTTTVFGPELETLFIRAVGAVGNYGEIYANNLEAIIPRGDMNRINTGESGLLYAFPFGDLTTVGPQIEVVSPTIAAMKERGFLRCGVNVRKGFANFDAATRTWSGFDVELCRALAAAVFDGADDRVLYVDLPAAQRFQVLAEERVDCLARLTTWTLARDVNESSIGQGMSFASPYFYDGVTFGGVPDFLECAETQDLFSPHCQGLRFCILEGTTGYNRVKDLFREEYISPRLNFDDIIAGLNDGSCNAIAGGFQDVAMENVRERGYLGPYAVGVKRYSKDPLAITTRQNDPAWSDFVRWVYWALVYAEEQGIRQETADQMPRNTLFGPLRTNMFYHAVNAVGSYGELYDRNFASLISRGGVHSINRGDTPQMVSLPGF